MKNQDMNAYRQKLNHVMIENDTFFKEFGELDNKVYSDGAINKKNKELMGLAISVVTRCNECILYHINGSVQAGADKNEIIEAIKIGIIGGGSITYPNARFAFEILGELKMLS